MLYGGAGNDTYIFNVGNGTDTIIDSEGINTILFGDGLTGDANFGVKHITIPRGSGKSLIFAIR